MEELHICKYCGVGTTQPDEECYAKPTKTMTAVEQFFKDLCDLGYIDWDDDGLVENKLNQALELEKQQQKQIVLNLLNHELGHDNTARLIAERLEANEIDLNDI